jgi:hypothetical protein
MRKAIAIVLSLVVGCSLFARDDGYKLKYDGGSIPDLKSGADVRLLVDTNTIHVLRKGEQIASFPVSSVTEISYGQDVHRRVGTAIGLAVVSLGVGALMALSKSKKHFIGITMTGAKRAALPSQADKNDYRGILAGLEGLTGKKAVNSDAMTVKN